MTEVNIPAIVVGLTTEDTVVTGPPKSLLVTDWIKPGFVDTIVKVEAGWVIVTGTVVVTTPAEVVGVGPWMIVTAETRPVDMLTTVAAGVDVVIVTTRGFDVPDGAVEAPLIVEVIFGTVDTV